MAWLIPVTQTEIFPRELKLEGIYAKYIEQAQLPEAGFAIDDCQLDQSLDMLWCLCPTPPALFYPSSYRRIILQWLQAHVQRSGKLNQLQRNEKAQLESLIEQLVAIALKSDEAISCIPADATRSSLNSVLTDYPMFSTLLFIESIADVQEKRWWFWLLVRLQRCVGVMTYEQCLAFDNARRTLKSYPDFALDKLINGSNVALAKFCTSISELAKFSHFFTRPPINRSTKPRFLPYQSDNEYVQLLSLSDDIKVDLFTPVDLDGNEKSTYFQFDTNVDDIKQQALTHQQQQRKYQLQRAGVESAIARANKMHPMSNSALTPNELNAWLNLHCPELFNNQLDRIPKEDRAHWFLFFLNIFLGKLDNGLRLFNGATTSNEQPSCLSIVYALDRKASCQVDLRLSSRLFKGKQAPESAKQYWSTQSYFDVALPWPLGSLLNLILRNIPTNKRHKISLYDAIGTTLEQHRRWLAGCINKTKALLPFKVTPSIISNAFRSFSVQTLPSVCADYLQQQGSVLMHYVNMERDDVASLARRDWFAFLNAVGLNEGRDWSQETSIGAMTLESFHEQIGSAITLRESVLPKVFDALLSPLTTLKLSPSNRVEVAQRIALYLHIRSAIELALRPVKAPYPLDQQVAWLAGVMTVQDKRVHHSQEQRLLVLSASLAELLQGYQAFCAELGCGYRIATSACLCVFDGQAWQALDPKMFTTLCERYIAPIDPGCFRHLSAHQLVQSCLSHSSQFDQQTLNQKMNHYKRGQQVLGEYSLCSIEHVIERQQQAQQHLMDVHPSYHAREVWAAMKKWDQWLLQWMGHYTQKECG
ncbi:hypothetical protein [Motilimonas sp. KMU-193]|uniref:hypothetical protein n=1 Tax=Motilimonas sp. KMU-193 TaxID=3388668 RepID=UPI00396B2011